MMKFAFFVRPHTGGTYSVYLQLREALRGRGVDLVWMAAVEPSRLADPRWSADLAWGAPIARRAPRDEAAEARDMKAALEAGGFDGVFVNVLGDRAATNLVRFLPSSLLRIMIVHNITPGTYAAARAIRDHVHATICVSPRIRADLVSGGGFPPARTVAVQNAGAVRAGDAPLRRDAARTGLDALFLGRIEDQSKGVFWLPRILGASPEDVRLTVVGDGPDLGRLRRRLAPFGARARLVGAVPAAEALALMARHDALIMPSRYEGFGVVLAEAMAMGCVPVASRIRGVTDVIVEDGREGLLFPVGDWRGAARRLAALRADRAFTGRLAAAAQAKARAIYSIDRLGDEYARVIHDLVAARPAVRPPVPIGDWRLPGGLRAGLRTHMPRRLKNALRVARERMRPGVNV
ncbi:glycosyltransferase family 4 protein [Pikeienuella sp. HZG-20]|uniref:glycosyltransferase family 4 protein n=1 Tax=Paludibacillus litoralis TaxID=3133267 RepID=UPI0030EE2798